MSTFKSLLAGFGGALALNIIHETVRNFDKTAPRIDKLGEEAISKSMEKIGVNSPKGDELYHAALAGDIMSNTLYYSLIDSKNPKHTWIKGMLFGLAAGFAAVSLPQPLGLDPAPVNETRKREAFTVIYYLTGGLITAAILNVIKKKK